MSPWQGDRKMRVAVIDSGVHAEHPHVQGVAGGVAILADGREGDDFTDRIGHGTAVTAAIREKAPEAEIFAVKIFHEELAAGISALVRAIEWSTREGMDLVNLSLGTTNPEHEVRLAEAVAQAAKRGCRIVAAGRDGDVRWLPGSLEGVLAVELDWDCPREEMRAETRGGRTVYRASGYPRPIPGVPWERNLKGLSFAVANVTGLLARRAPET
jgi:subtilisin family serine protease